MQELFERLIQEHRPLVRRTARRIGGAAGVDAADDIEQDVFLSLWRQVRRGAAIEVPAGYLYRMTVRESLRTARRRRAESCDVAQDETLCAGGPSPEDLLGRRMNRAHLTRALRRMPPERRLAAVRHLAGGSVAELMAETGWSYQKARNLVSRGLGDLKRTMSARLGAPAGVPDAARR